MARAKDLGSRPRVKREEVEKSIKEAKVKAELALYEQEIEYREKNYKSKAEYRDLWKNIVTERKVSIEMAKEIVLRFMEGAEEYYKIMKRSGNEGDEEATAKYFTLLDKQRQANTAYQQSIDSAVKMKFVDISNKEADDEDSFIIRCDKENNDGTNS